MSEITTRLHKAAAQTSESRANEYLATIERDIPQLRAWLSRDALDKEHWLTAHAPTARFGILTSNDAESFAATMMPARKMFILPAVQWIIDWGNRHYLQVG